MESGGLEQQLVSPDAEAIVGPRPLIAVAGSTRASAKAEELARELGEALVSAGFRIVCGGLGGVMAAASRGARRSDAWTGNDVVGLLPGWEADEGNPWIDIPLRTGLGRYRNMLLASACDALVAIEGGAGTLSEMALAWQEDRPLLVLGNEGTSGQISGTVLDHRRSDTVQAYDNVAALMAELDRLFPRGCFGSRSHSQWFHEEVPCLHRVYNDQRPPAPTSAHGLQMQLGFSVGYGFLKQKLLQLAEQLRRAQPAGASQRKLLVTFDDGYRDLLQLVPWFRKQTQLQPMVLVSTATLRGEPHWFDLLYQALSNFCANGHTVEEALRARSEGLAADLRAVVASRATDLVLSWARGQGLALPEVPANTYLEQEDLEGLVEAGWIVGSHGEEHHDLRLLPDDHLDRELEHSLETVLGLNGRPFLAYPDGSWDERVRRRAIRAGYSLLFSIDGATGPNRANQVNRTIWPLEARR